MGLNAVRIALRAQLLANSEVADMFKTVLVEVEPKPNDLDAIVIKKMKSSEQRNEFAGGYQVDVKYIFDIICVMKHPSRENGDVAQINADEYVRQAIEDDVTLSGAVSFASPTTTTWGVDASDNEIYYSVITVECALCLDPVDR